MNPSSESDKAPSGGYVPWTPPGAPPAARWSDAMRPLALILGAAALVALLVAWISTREQPEAPSTLTEAGGSGAGVQLASLLVDSEPVGATVWVNGDSVGLTPAWLPEIDPGVIEVVLASEGTLLDTTLALKAGQDASVLIWLQSERLAQEPAPRPQEIEERPASERPASERPAPVRPSAERPDRGRQNGERAGPSRSAPEIATAEVSAEPGPPPARSTGRLQVTTVPAGAMVWAGGERVGRTPLTLDALPVGEQIVELRAQGYEPERLRLEIAAGELTSRSIELRPRPGIVSVVADPGARVFIDGEIQGTVRNAPLRLPLAAGRYEVRVFHPVYGESFRVVQVTAGTSLRLDFERSGASEATAGGDGDGRRTGW